MKTIKPKIFLIIFAIVCALALAPKFAQVSASTLKLDPASDTVEAGKDLEVKVVLSGTDELIDGVDAIVSYDPGYLQLKEIKDDTFFNNYPVKVDDNNGKITVTALAPKEGVKLLSDITVVTLTFEILDSGDTNLTINYEKDSTKDSNVPLHGTSVDTLTAVTGGEYSVTATPENLNKARAKKTSSGPSALLLFIIILVLIAIGFWWWWRNRKKKEDVYTPEPFPMDRPPEDNNQY